MENKTLKILLVFTITLLFGFIGYLIYSNYQLKKEVIKIHKIANSADGSAYEANDKADQLQSDLDDTNDKIDDLESERE